MVCVYCHRHHNAPYKAVCVTLHGHFAAALADDQLQTNNPLQNTWPDWHTLSTHRASQNERGGQPVAEAGEQFEVIFDWISKNVLFFFKARNVWDLGAFGSEAGLEWGEVRNQQAKGSRGFWVAGLRFPPFCGLEDIAARPLRYCRLTAHYLHHQNAATPNKEGKNKTK